MQPFMLPGATFATMWAPGLVDSPLLDIYLWAHWPKQLHITEDLDLRWHHFVGRFAADHMTRRLQAYAG